MSQARIRDITGAEIVPNSLIVYAAAMGSSTYLYWGRVTAVKPSGAITFQGIERWGGVNGPILRDRLTTMHSPEKTVVISWSRSIPDHVRRLLDPNGEYAAALGQVAPPPTTGGLVG